MATMSSKDSFIQEENIRLHKAQAAFFEITHPEIFNVFEQRRLGREIVIITKDLHSTCANVACLDLGSGTGNIVRHLQHIKLDVACDLSIEMLKQNPSKYKVCCDATQLPFKDKAFDLVTSFSFFHHIPHCLTTVKEVCRVSKENSKLYFDHDPFTTNDVNKVSKHITDNRFGVIFWCLTNPRLLPTFAKYLIRRKSYLQFMKGVNWTLTEENSVPTNRIITLLEENDFSVKLKDYGRGQLLSGGRCASLKRKCELGGCLK